MLNMTALHTSIVRSFAGALFLASVAALSAQSVVTEPVGFTTLTVNAKPASIRGFTYLSLNMFRPTAYRSVIPSAATVGGVTVLTFPANSFTANQFVGVGNASFVEISPTGAYVNGVGPNGIFADITANTTNTITLAEDVTSFITGGTSAVKVRPHWTFATVFGTNNSAGLQGGAGASTADTVAVLNPVNGASSIYYYSTNNNRWQTGLSTDSTNTVLRPDAGFVVERKSGGAVSFTLVGEVKLGPSELVVQGGGASGNFNVIPNPYPLSSVTLASSGLFTGNPATGVQGGAGATTADTLSVFNSTTGASTIYYYSTNNNRWQTGLSTDASNVTIGEGASVVIFRRAGRPTFSWYVPQPTMNL